MPTNSPVRYFLKVDGVIGDVTDKAHKGWFAVDDYDIGVTTPFSSAAGTEVTGRTQFSPLSVDIHSLTGVSALLADELTNKSISSVELVGVETTAKGTQQTVYDLKLTDALVGSFENDPGSKGVDGDGAGPVQLPARKVVGGLAPEGAVRGKGSADFST